MRGCLVGFGERNLCEVVFGEMGVAGAFGHGIGSWVGGFAAGFVAGIFGLFAGVV